MRHTSMVCLLAFGLTFGGATQEGGVFGAKAAAADAPKDAAAESMETVPVVVDYRTCLALTGATTTGRGVVPADGAAYQPGVDVNGRPVVPAEGPGGSGDWLQLGDTITLDLTLDLVERYGPRVPPGTKLPLGTIEVRDGRAWFNGRPIAGGDREALWEACRRLGAVQGAAERPKPKR